MTKKLLWQDELNPRVRCAFGNVLNFDREIGCAERKMENRARGGRPPRWGGNRAGKGGGGGGGGEGGEQERVEVVEPLSLSLVTRPLLLPPPQPVAFCRFLIFRPLRFL